AAVAEGQRAALGPVREPLSASEVERLAEGAEDDRHDLGFAGEALDGGHARVARPVQQAETGAVVEVVEVHGGEDDCPLTTLDGLVVGAGGEVDDLGEDVAVAL